MDTSLPFVSVVMPVLNESRFIQRALEAVLDQDYPTGCLEVLVVDGGSDDDTRAQVATLSIQDDRVRLLDNPGRIQACALNIGIRAARGDVIVRVDGHTIIASDYIQRCVFHLRHTGADNVGGLQRVVGETRLGHTIAAAYRSPFSVPSRFTTSTRAEYVDTVYLGAWPRTVFERVGYFDETLEANEDYEFNYRIRRTGGRIYLSPDIRADYYGRQTWRTLWRQFHRYGYWKFTMLRRNPQSVRARHLIAPLFVAALIGGLLLAPLSRLIRELWVLTISSYSILASVATVQTVRQHNQASILRLPGVFATMHLAWGTGFWRSLINALRGTMARTL